MKGQTGSLMEAGVDKGQIRRFTGNDYTSDLTKGDFAACIAWVTWSSSRRTARTSTSYSGYMTSSDNMLIPNTAREAAGTRCGRPRCTISA